jgi:hypothetical protein
VDGGVLGARGVNFQMPLPPSILAPSRHADASDPTKRGGLRRPIRLKVRVWHICGTQG